MASRLPVSHPSGNRLGRLVGGSWLDTYTALVVLGFGAVVLGPSLIGARVLVSVNLFSQQLPWRANGLTVNGHQVCTTDTIDAVLPGVAFIRNQLYGGHLGTWQSYVAGGGTMSANPNLGLLDPIAWPYLLLPLWLAPAFVMLLQLTTAIVGTNLFLRRLGASRASGLLAGLIYATTGFMVVWSNWPQTRVGALVPLLLWSVERLIQRVRVTDSLVIALVVAAMLLGGFPQVTGLALYLAGGYLLVRVAALHYRDLRTAAKTVGLSVLGLALGAGLSMVQMLPFLANIAETDLSYRSNGLPGLPAASLITTVVPNAYGSCIYGRPVHSTINPIELIAYVGAAAIVLAAVGAAAGVTRPRRLTRSVRAYFVAAVLVVVVLGWVSRDAREIAVHFPVFADNFIGRIRVILGFLLAVLAGLGFETLVRNRRDVPEPDEPDSGPPRTGLRRYLWPAVWVVAIGLVALEVLRLAHRAAYSGNFAHGLRHDAMIPAALAVLALLAVLAVRSRVRPVRVAALVVVPILVAVQSASFFHTILPGDDPDEFYPVTRTHTFIDAEIGHDRFAAAGTMFPATALYYGLRTPTGHSFHEPAWRKLLEAVDPKVMQSPTNSAFTNTVTEQTIGHSPILDRLGVRYFAMAPNQVAGVVGPAKPSDGTVTVAAGKSTSCTLDSQPLRAIQITLPHGLSAASVDRGLTLHLTVQAGGRTITAGRFWPRPYAAGEVVAIPLVGDGLPTGGPLTATVSVSGAAGPMVVAASAGAMLCTPITPANDGLKLVYADPASIVYERLSALPRIRWAGSTRVIAGVPAQVAALKAGVPAATVVLDKPGPAGSGQPATVGVTADDGAHIAADVTASGAGYLVVADAIQVDGWTVTIDGKAAPLVHADAAMGAVAVPAGKHHIAFTYNAPRLKLGAALSAVTALVMVGLLLWDRRRRPEPAAEPTPDEPAPDLDAEPTPDEPTPDLDAEPTRA